MQCSIFLDDLGLAQWAKLVDGWTGLAAGRRRLFLRNPHVSYVSYENAELVARLRNEAHEVAAMRVAAGINERVLFDNG